MTEHKEKRIVESLEEEPPENESLEHEAKLIERAVYGKLLIIHTEPSIGTADTPPRTDEEYPFHPGGHTKQGNGEPVDFKGPSHGPRRLSRQEKQREEGE